MPTNKIMPPNRIIIMPAIKYVHSHPVTPMAGSKQQTCHSRRVPKTKIVH